MPRIRVLYFAAIRELVGKDDEELSLPDAIATVAGFMSWIEQAKPPLSGRMASVRVAKNECFARNEEPLVEGDVLALIPPVAGG